jgi:hypothetical protein
MIYSENEKGVSRVAQQISKMRNSVIGGLFRLSLQEIDKTGGI